jgi:hypothetical protein
MLARNHHRLQNHWAKPLDMQRAKSLNPAATSHWFRDVVQPEIYDPEIDDELIYGMDEGAFCKSDQNKEFVVGVRGTKTQHKQGGGSKKNVTAIVTICADGTTTQPTLIYSGLNMMKKFGNNNVADVR